MLTTRFARAAVSLGVLLLLSMATISQAGATTHAPYPLGSAKSCKAHYVKRVLKHVVKGKTLTYLACVYVAPKVKNTPPPTTTSTPPTTTTLAAAVATTTTLSVSEVGVVPETVTVQP